MEYNFPIPEQLSQFPTVGGGDEYDPDRFFEPDRPSGDRVRASDADYAARSADELADALERAGRGDVVWVPGDEAIDVRGLSGVEIDAGVILASDRGLNGSSGALLYTPENPEPLFKIVGAGARVTGIRFKGPVTTHVEYSWKREGNCVSVRADDVEIDNCVFRGWGYACVELGRTGFVEDSHVHHNHFVDNPMQSLGYGVVVRHADPLIQSNYFDYNRHAISGSGYPDCSFVARNNFCGPHTILAPFDMHRENEVDSSGGWQAGKRFEIVQNVVLATTHAGGGHDMTGIFIRGVPMEESLIANNQFAHPGKPVGAGESGDAYVISMASDLEEANTVAVGNYYDEPDPRPTFEH